jgi:hypothetical protein
MQNLGISFFDAQGNFVGLRESIKRLEDSTKDLSQEQRQQAIETIFGSDASRAAIVLADQGVAGFDKLRDSITRQGIAAEVAGARTSGINGSLEALRSTLETTLLDFGNFVAKGIKPFIDFAAGNLSAVLAGVASGIAAIGVAALISSFGVKALGFALLTALKVGLLGTGIGLLVGGLVFLQQKFDIVGKAIEAGKGLIEVFGKALDTAKQVVLDIANGALTWVNDRITDFKRLLGEAKDKIIEYQDAIKNTAIVLGVLFGPALIKAGIQAAITAGVMVIEAVKAGTAWVIQAGRAALAWLVQFAVMTARAIITGVVMGVAAIGAAAIWVAQAAVAGIAWLGQFALMSARAVATAVVFLAQAAIGGWAWIAQGILVGLTWLAQFAVMVAGAIASAAVIAAQGIIAALPWIIAFAPVILIVAALAAAAFLVITNWDKVKSFLTGVFTVVKDAVEGAHKKVKEFVENFVEVGKGIIDGIAKGIGNAKDAVINKIKEICNNSLNEVKKFFGIKSPSRVMAQQGRYIAEGLAVGIGQGQSLVDTAISGLGGDISPTIAPDVVTDTISPQTRVGETSAAAGGTVSINVHMDGIMTRSRSDLRDVAKDLVESINEELRARQLPELGNGAIKL